MNHIHQAVLAQASHGIAKRTHPRQDDLVRIQYGLPIPCDDRRLSQGYQCFLYAAQVACVIINYGNHIINLAPMI